MVSRKYRALAKVWDEASAGKGVSPPMTPMTRGEASVALARGRGKMERALKKVCGKKFMGILIYGVHYGGFIREADGKPITKVALTGVRVGTRKGLAPALASILNDILWTDAPTPPPGKLTRAKPSDPPRHD